MMTTVHWWSDLHYPEQLKTERYHADCAPPFDAARVILYRPGFEWEERWTSSGEGLVSIKLVPVVADQVVDTESGHTVRNLGRPGRGFIACAECTDHEVWKVTTQGCGTGSRRYTRAWSEEEAKKILEAWYTRRFRFADRRIPS